MSNLLMTTVVGRLGSDPEDVTTATGKQVVKFSVAVNQYNKDTKAEETVWVKCSAWDRNREYVLKHLKRGKGEFVWVTGNHSMYEPAGGDSQDQLNVRAIGAASTFFGGDEEEDDDGAWK
jgi:single-stranded DNA-binding protein